MDLVGDLWYIVVCSVCNCRCETILQQRTHSVIRPGSFVHPSCRGNGYNSALGYKICYRDAPLDAKIRDEADDLY